jgi:hypothetical protein
MRETQDIYTTLLGLRSQIKKAEDTIDTVQSNYDSLCTDIGNDVSLFEDRKKEIDEELEKIKNLVTNLCSTRKDYISKQQEASEKSEEQKAELNNGIERLKEIVFEPAHQIINTMQPVLANDIYDKCDRIKDDLDLFETQIWNQIRQPDQKEFFPNGLTNKNHLRIFLMGEFSSGKTTFLQRILNQKAGEIAAGPTTGLLVIHKVSNDESIEVTCNDRFEISNNLHFATFLQRWYLSTEFTQVGTAWMVKNPNTRIMLNPLFSSAQIMQFTAEANLYPEAFKEIIWTHKEKPDTNPVFKFADLYDMPGIGSSVQQHLESINYTLQEYAPDIIFYLVDSGNAIPSGTGTVLLNNVLDIVNKLDTKPLFFWVYEKPTGNEKNEWKVSLDSNGQIILDETFLSDMRVALQNYIEKVHTNENNFEFSPVQKNYLNDSYILDIRGPKNQVSETITNAIAFAMQRYYCKQTSDLILTLIQTLSTTTYKNNLFNTTVSEAGEALLKEIVDEIIKTAQNKSPSEISLEEAKGIVFSKLDLFKKLPSDAHEELKSIDWRVTTKINNFLQYFADMLGFGSNINLNKLENNWKFKTAEFINIFPLFQTYYQQKQIYEKNINPNSLASIGSAIINIVQKDLEYLNKITTKVPICVPLSC